MIQIEVFNGTRPEQLQKQVNSFLRKLPADALVNILQSEAMSNDLGISITITVVYREGANI